MKKVLRSFRVLPWGLLILALVLTGCQPTAQATPSDVTPAADLPAVVSATGVVVPAQWAALSLAGSGRVAELLVNEGDSVSKDQVLLRLEGSDQLRAALAAFAVEDSRYLVEVADVALGLSLEALLGCSAAFDERVHSARGQVGQMETAAHLRSVVEGSTLLDKAGRVQDAYSLRCAPQVQGPVRDTLEFVEKIVEREINAATDNPLIFDPDVAISGGNFHGEPIGMVMDYLGIAMSELAAISERRVFRLTDGKLNGGLPPMLVDSMDAAGLNSGLMMPQYSAASLVLENQTLATPDSVHSLPTSGEQEDHNANAMTAARHARQIVDNTTHVLAIELYSAARAVDLRLRQYPNGQLGVGTHAALGAIRQEVPYQAGDALWGPEIESIQQMIRQQRIPTGFDTAQ